MARPKKAAAQPAATKEDITQVNVYEPPADTLADDFEAILMGADGGGEDSGESDVGSGDSSDSDGGSGDGPDADVSDAGDDADGDSSSGTGSDDEDSEEVADDVDGEDEEEEEDEDEGEEGKDGKKNDKSEKHPRTAKERIRQLVSVRNEKDAEINRLKAEIDRISSQQVASNDEHPDPEAEVEQLRNQYKNIKSPDKVVKDGVINPLTGEPYTPAEAEAAVANLKQDIQFKINEAQSAVVGKMSLAREAEAMSESLRIPLSDLITKYPVLDQDSKNADADLCAVLQSVIDANTIVKGGLLTGFKTPPETFLKSFENMLKKTTSVKVNEGKKLDNKRDKTAESSGKAPAKRGKMSAEDEFMAIFDDAFGRMV